jgi:hypothetical protein
MNAFEQYLEWHEIDPIRLSIAAKVRYMAIWKAKKGLPISSESAQKIREAVFRLTGSAYVGSFVLIQDAKIEALPISVESILGHHH